VDIVFFFFIKNGVSMHVEPLPVGEETDEIQRSMGTRKSSRTRLLRVAEKAQTANA
jgi:hypothetical protein